jgi:hypothetical protein
MKMPLSGIENTHISDIAHSGETLYLASNKGFFVVTSEGTAYSANTGLTNRDVRAVAVASAGKLYLATADGLFCGTPDIDTTQASKVTVRSSQMPTIRQVHAMALHYNEVDPEMIRQWRKKLKNRAFMPSVNVGYDKSIYGTAGTDDYQGKSYVGPVDWGVSMSWDMGDLIWNTYEDDIDTRARLNTQLRSDILDEVNRLYFECKRTALALDGEVPEGIDRSKKELRLEELTASLDGYTGGWFSSAWLAAGE